MIKSKDNELHNIEEYLELLFKDCPPRCRIFKSEIIESLRLSLKKFKMYLETSGVQELIRKYNVEEDVYKFIVH